MCLQVELELIEFWVHGEEEYLVGTGVKGDVSWCRVCREADPVLPEPHSDIRMSYSTPFHDGTLVTPSTEGLSLASLALRWRSQVVVMETIRPTEPKTFAVWRLPGEPGRASPAACVPRAPRVLQPASWQRSGPEICFRP